METKIITLFENEIKLEVTDNVLDRYFRLNRILGYMFSHDSNVLPKIEKLVDIHGDLEIYWKLEPSNINILSSKTAWESVIGDCSSHVEHFFNNNCIASFS